MTLIIKDSMVLIHLAKMGILENSCDYFNEVVIPEAVFNETVVEGKKSSHLDAAIIEQMIKLKKIKVKSIKNKNKIKEYLKYGLHYGEAEAIELYFQEDADILASDDDVIRKNRALLNINLIGTPAVLIILLRKKGITKRKAIDACEILESIGWFHEDLILELKNQIEKFEK